MKKGGGGQAEGDLIWNFQINTGGDDSARGVAVDSANNVYVVGNTDSNLYGDTPVGSYDSFVIKFDSTGARVGSRLFGSTDTDPVYDVYVDASDNVYAGGETRGSLPGFSNAGGSDAYVYKFNSNLEEQWHQQFGTTEYEFYHSTLVDKYGNVIMAITTTAGKFDGFINNGDAEIYLLKYDAEGGKR